MVGWWGAGIGALVGGVGYGIATDWKDGWGALGAGVLGGVAGGFIGDAFKSPTVVPVRSVRFAPQLPSSGASPANVVNKIVKTGGADFVSEVIEKGVANFGGAVANQLVASNSQNKPSGNSPPSFQPLYKKDLNQYAVENGLCNPCTDQKLGYVFEDIFEEAVKPDPNSVLLNFRKGSKLFGDVKNTKTDFEMDAVFVPRSNPFEMLLNTKRIIGGTSFELKAKDGTLILSQNVGQLLNHIDNLFDKHSDNIAKYGKYGFRPELNIITIADTRISNAIYAHGAGKVHLYHKVAYFMKLGTSWNFIFK